MGPFFFFDIKSKVFFSNIMPKRKQKKGSHKNKSRNNPQQNESSRKQGQSQSYGISKSQQSTVYYFLGGFALIFLFCAFFIYLPQLRAMLGFADKNYVDPATMRGYRTRLKRLYEKYNPNKLDSMEEILLKYRGREKELFKKLHQKYVRPNKKVRDKKRREKREKKRRQRAGLDDDDLDDINRDDETEEEAAIRRRRKKERDREKRKEKRRKERGGKEYGEDWDDEKNKKYKKYFNGDTEDFYGDDDAQFEGEIDLMDDDEED